MMFFFPVRYWNTTNCCKVFFEWINHKQINNQFKLIEFFSIVALIIPWDFFLIGSFLNRQLLFAHFISIDMLKIPRNLNTGRCFVDNFLLLNLAFPSWFLIFPSFISFFFYFFLIFMVAINMIALRVNLWHDKLVIIIISFFKNCLLNIFLIINKVLVRSSQGFFEALSVRSTTIGYVISI